MAPLVVGHPLLDRRPPAAGHHRLDGLDDEEEDGGCDRHELNHVGDERSVAKHGVVDRERQVAEVRLAQDHRDDRHEQVPDERVDHRGEREAHDERHRELHDVAPQQKVPELLEHRLLLDASRVARGC
ncbi:MAG TPA: hypothetical protein VGQ15_06820 [Gaiellaceae bacterium]|nr:hypothetical protein [Gaiellaceae bacterium]